MKKFTLLLMMLLCMTGAKADVEWTIWEGSATKTDVSLAPVDLSNIIVGDKIYVYGTGTLSKRLGKQTGDEWSFGDISGYTPTETGTDANYYYTVDAALVTLFASSDFKAFVIRNWDSGTITKVTIKKKNSMIKTTLSSESKSADTFDYTIPKEDFSNMAAGDFLYLPASKRDAVAGKNYKVEFKETDKWTYYTTVSSPTHDVIWTVESSTIDAGIREHPLYICGELYNVSGVYMYHPVSSFSIGSIGYATFSANQEVTAPEGVTAYKATVEGNSVKLTQFTDNVIPANTGAIIKGDQGAVLEFLASSTGSTETSDLQAVSTATEVTTLEDGYDYYVLYNNPTGGNYSLSLSNDADLSHGWNSTYSASNKTITFTENWGARGWSVNSNLSAYNSVVVEFGSAAPCNGVLKVGYNDEESDQQVGYEASATSVTITLDPERKTNNVTNIYLSASAASDLVISSAYIVPTAGSQKAEFRKTTSGTLAANKAYLKIPEGSAHALSIVFDDDNETTGINIVQSSERRVQNGVYYNLAGQRVDHPVKGLYIKNGKKVILK